MSHGFRNVTVREATRADLLGVTRIEAACFEEPWPFAAFEHYLDIPAFLVADSPVGLDGFVVGDVTPNYGRDVGHVKDLAVDPQRRGRGVGRLLLRSALVRMQWNGAAVVKLEVRESNDPARELYRTEGFETLRRVPGYYGNGESALIMVLDVAEWAEDVDAQSGQADGTVSGE